MKTSTKRFLNIALAFALLLSMQIACGAPMTEEPINIDATEAPVINSPIPGDAGTWLVMLYEDADDEVLEEDIVFDMNEAELVGSTDAVTIVAQLDRFAGGFDGDGDVTSTRRYLLTQDDDLYTINSEVLEDLGELDMGDPQTLYDFATWAMLTYPAEHYVLILSDHGAGWTGGWTDDDPTEHSGLSMQEIDTTLGAILTNTGVSAFELVGFDACLMGQLEVMSSIAPHARYAVGSEETEPALGWAYTSFLAALNENPSMNGGELGQIIVDSYIAQDTRITDSQARRVLTGDDYSEDSVAAQLSKNVTLTTVDLGTMQDINAAVNDLAVALTNIDQEIVAQARAYAQSYTSTWWDGIPPSFIDLGHFTAVLLDNTDDPGVRQAAENVQTALAQSVVAEKHGDERPGSSGLTIFFPNSELYEVTFLGSDIGYDQYTSFAGRFATASLWDDFLTYHYAGESFDPAAVDLAVLSPAESAQTDFVKAAEESAPEVGAEVAAPGSGELTIAPLTISASEIGLDGTVTLSTEITGTNIAYVYYYVSYYFEDDGSYLSADMGYLNSDAIKEISGVYYPDWGNEGIVPIEFDWTPSLYFMSDGNAANDQFAFFEPTVYGTEVDTFTVRGTYTFADSGNEMDAEIDFYGSDLQSVWGFTGDEDSAGAWSQITPQPGDTFTITNEWLEFDQNPDGEFVDYPDGVMTFGDTPFTMVEYYAYTGYYALAIGVEDFDGNIIWEFTELTVTE
jgi:hypothetical protein